MNSRLKRKDKAEETVTSKTMIVQEIAIQDVVLEAGTTVFTPVCGGVRVTRHFSFLCSVVFL
jgi:hypothetical protein